MKETLEPIHILLVEDNPGDADLTREALEECHSDLILSVAESGEVATDFLLKRNGYQQAVRPDIILLDLNLPGMSGHEVLEEIAPCADLKEIPVFVLTTSDSDKDKVQAYILYASGFINKPLDGAKFKGAVESMGRSWFKVLP